MLLFKLSSGVILVRDHWLRCKNGSGKRIDRKDLSVAICLFLAVSIFLLYWPTGNFDFTNYDDPIYATQNPHIVNGLTLQNIYWAFTSVKYFYHPITWLSLMLDSTLFRGWAGGYHLVNVWLHVFNVVLLFILLQETTGAIWRSCVAAVLFGIHPINVETVAWISERKGLLCTFFMLSAFLAYVRYARKPSVPSYMITLVLFLCGTFSKPMVVTFPFILLLLDLWPLNRITFCGPRKFLKDCRIIAEKVPFLALALICSLLTISAERNAGALSSGIPVTLRIENAIVSYIKYIRKLILPIDLAAFYPMPLALDWKQVVLALFLLLCVSAVSFVLYSRHPYITVGWFFFILALLPASGLVHVGAHSMADRYAYIPCIGLFVGVVWGVDAYIKISGQRLTAILVLACILFVLARCSTKQMKTWRDSVALFEQANKVTQDNFVADINLCLAHAAANDDTVTATYYIDRAMTIRPDLWRYRWLFATIEAAKGKTEEAASQFRATLHAAGRNFEFAHDFITFVGNSGDVQSLDLSNAVYLANDLRVSKPLDARTLAALGQIYARSGLLADAVRVTSMAIDGMKPQGNKNDNDELVCRMLQYMGSLINGSPQQTTNTPPF